MILAHLGGIDEIGLFLVPALLAVLTIRWAERKARQRTAESDDDNNADTFGR